MIMIHVVSVNRSNKQCTGVGWIFGGILKFGREYLPLRVYRGGVDFGENFKIWS